MRSIVFAIMGAGALWAGGQGLYTAATNREPVSVTCAEYYENGAEGLWLNVSECEIAWDDVVYIEGLTGSIRNVMLPLVPPGFTGKPKVVVSSEDKGLRADITKLNNVLESGTQEEIDGFLAGPGKGLVGLQEFQGLKEYGFTEFEDDERNKMEGLVTNLDEDYVVVKDNEKPKLAFHAVLFVIGLAFVAPLRRFLRRGAVEA